MKLSFIGLGQMGKGMAMNLTKSNCELIVNDVNDKVFPVFQEKGIKTTLNIQETTDSDIIFLCLPDDKIVETVLFGDNGILKNLKTGQVIVDCSTLNYLTTLKIAERVEATGVYYMDAPVSGRQSKADDGTLAIMVGGNEEVFNKIKPLLDYMGNNVIHMGKNGNGQLTKMINNCIYDINIAAIAELLPMAVKLGLDPEQIGKIVNSGTARSNASEFFIPKMLEGDFSYGFTMNAAYKDLVSAVEIAQQRAIPIPILDATNSTYKMALNKGYGELYKGAMICVYEEMIGVKFRKTVVEKE